MVLYIVVAILVLLGHMSCAQKSTPERSIRVAVLLPIKGKLEYREYENGREVGAYLLEYLSFGKHRADKGYIYSSMARDRVEEAAMCGDLLTTTLKSIKGKKLEIEVVDRKNIDKIFEEQKFQHSGFIDTSTMVEIGRLLGANYLIFVEPRYISFKKDSYQDVRKIGVPLVFEKGKYFCVSFKASVRLKISVVNVETGKVLVSKVYEGYGGPEKQCSKTGFRTDELPSYDDLIDEAIKDSASDFASEFCSLEL